MTRRPLLLILIAALPLSACSLLKGNGPKTTPVIGDRTSILGSKEAEVTIDPSLADVAVLLPPAITNADWDQPGGSPTHSLGHLALPETLGLAWQARTEGITKATRLAAAPVVVGGKLFAIDTDARVRAFDAATGAELWTMQLAPADGRNSRSLYGGGVSASGDRVYATNGLGEVAALDSATGAQIWRVKPGGPLRGSPTLAFGSLFVLSQDNQLFSLRATDGDLQWTQSGSVEGANVFGVAAPAAGQGTVVAGFSSGELGGYRYENGQPVWQDQLSRTRITTSVGLLSDVDANPVIDQGRVYALGQGGRMVSLELVTGQRLWELNVAGIATPWVAGEWLWAVTDGGVLFAVARSNGKIRWKTQLPRYRKPKSQSGPISWQGPVLAGGRLILVSSEGQMAEVDPATGAVTRSIEVGSSFHLPPVVANGTLYLLDDDGTISARR